jgi:hypothetical protein
MMMSRDVLQQLIVAERAHLASDCPACLRAVEDLTAPACPRMVALGREAREALRRLSRRTGRPTWDLEAEARGSER